MAVFNRFLLPFDLLAGNPLVMQNSRDDDSPHSGKGAVAFTTPVDVGENYAVTVLTQPSSPIQPHAVPNGSGTINHQDITDVMVSGE